MADDLRKIIVDGKEIEVDPSITVLQACEQAGAEIPRFCYHERLSIAGNCRMCLVEIVGAPKPLASCAGAVKDLRPGRNGEPPEINTKTPYVKKAREGVMEFLLINHPLDCPICDQGGECDLQDQAMYYGVDTSRYADNKRAVENKYIGPLVKTIMTRCIHCTRCIRFATEVAGVPELGAIGRGEDMEITTYLESALSSELQGNAVDLCPVGALTHRPYAFKARPWEQNRTQAIDVMDALGSNIRIDSRGREVLRIVARTHDGVNEEWISDKTRYVWDGLKAQRLDRPYVRVDGRLKPASWAEAFTAIADRIKATTPDRIGAIAGDLCAAEDMFALKALMDRIGVRSLDCRQDGAKLHPGHGRASYTFNATVEGIDDADAILLIGSNPRWEAPVLNARIRKRWLESGLPVASIGTEQPDLTYPYQHLGNGTQTLADIAAGNGTFFETLSKAERPMIVIGQGALTRADGESVLAAAATLAKAVGALSPDADPEWNGFNVLHTAASRVAGLDLGLVPGEGGRDVWEMILAGRDGALDVLFLMAADEIVLDGMEDTFVVYQGSHGDRGAHRADVILPAATYAEKSGTYVNTEGRVQLANRAAFPPGEAREDWAILRALSDVLGKRLPFDSLQQLRAVMCEAHPHLGDEDTVLLGDPSEITRLADVAQDLDDAPFDTAVKDFYLTNPIARASGVMAELSALAKARANAGETLQAAE